MTCPWCGSTTPPLLTSEHPDEANFVYPSGNKKADIKRNPLMCADCCGVGGREDFSDE